MMDQISKFITSAVVIFLFVFSLIFCFDSPDTFTHYLVGQYKRVVLGRYSMAHRQERRQAMKHRRFIIYLLLGFFVSKR